MHNPDNTRGAAGVRLYLEANGHTFGAYAGPEAGCAWCELEEAVYTVNGKPVCSLHCAREEADDSETVTQRRARQQRQAAESSSGECDGTLDAAEHRDVYPAAWRR